MFPILEVPDVPGRTGPEATVAVIIELLGEGTEDWRAEVGWTGVTGGIFEDIHNECNRKDTRVFGPYRRKREGLLRVL